MKIDKMISKKIYFWAQFPMAFIIGVLSSLGSLPFAEQYGPISAAQKIYEPIVIFIVGFLFGILITFLPLLLGATILSIFYYHKFAIKLLFAILVPASLSVLISIPIVIFSDEFNFLDSIGFAKMFLLVALIPTIFGLVPFFKIQRQRK